MVGATKSQSKGKLAKAPKAKPEALIDDDNDAPVQKQAGKRKRDEEIVEGPKKKKALMKKTPASTKTPSKASKSTLSTLSAKHAKPSQKPSAKPSSKASNPTLSTLNDKPATVSAKPYEKPSQPIPSSSDALDIVGTYRITSTELEAKYLVQAEVSDTESMDSRDLPFFDRYPFPKARKNTEFEISIHHKRFGPSQKYHLFAAFSFYNVVGFMRFENITPEPSSFTIDGSDNDAPRYIHPIPDIDDRTKSLSYKRRNFLLEPGYVPSTQNPTWRYRWRGRENVTPDVEDAEPVIQYQSDKVAELITFTSSTQLTGTFNGISFTGEKIKTSDEMEEPEKPDEFWKKCGELQYRIQRRKIKGKAYKEPNFSSGDEMGDKKWDMRLVIAADRRKEKDSVAKETAQLELKKAEKKLKSEEVKARKESKAGATKSQGKGKLVKAPKAKPEAFIDVGNDPPVEKEAGKRMREEEIVEGPRKKTLKKPAAAKTSTKASSKTSAYMLSTLNASPATATPTPSANTIPKASKPMLSTLNAEPAARPKKPPAKASIKKSQAIPPKPVALDVAGIYRITSPGLEVKYNQQGMVSDPEYSDSEDPKPFGYTRKHATLKLEICHASIGMKYRPEKYQLFADFSFCNMSGMMRFENTTPKPSSFTIDKSNNDAPRFVHPLPIIDERKYYIAPIPESVDLGYGRGISYRRKNFVLEDDQVPTTQNQTWRYRWRGRVRVTPGDEEAEPIIQYPSDKVAELITFISSTQLTGTFNGIPFTGQKIGRDEQPTRYFLGNNQNPDDFWVKCGERKYRIEQAAITGKAYKVPECKTDEFGDEDYAVIRRMAMTAANELMAEKELKAQKSIHSGPPSGVGSARIPNGSTSNGATPGQAPASGSAGPVTTTAQANSTSINRPVGGFS